MAIAQEFKQGLMQACIKGPDDEYGLGDLVRGHTAQMSEEKRKVESGGESKFDVLLKKYEAILLSFPKPYNVGIINKKNKFIEEITDVLTPDEINIFLQATIRYEDYDAYSSDTGRFITQLIQNSHLGGYENFIINASNIAKRIHNIGGKRIINNVAGRPINITINGSVGIYFGLDSKFSRFTVNGNAGLGYGTNTEHCTFIINGDVLNNCGINSKYSSFTINGNVSIGCGNNAYSSRFTITGSTGLECGSHSFNSSFIIGEYADSCLGTYAIGSKFTINNEFSEIDIGKGALNCIFKTPNSKTLGKLLEYVPLKCGHKIYFIHSNGREELVRADKVYSINSEGKEELEKVN